jgi:hypothetical protein
VLPSLQMLCSTRKSKNYQCFDWDSKVALSASKSDALLLVTDTHPLIFTNALWLSWCTRISCKFSTFSIKWARVNWQRPACWLFVLLLQIVVRFPAFLVIFPLSSQFGVSCRSRKLRLMTVGDPPRWPRDIPLSTKVGTKFRRQVAVVQSV